MKNTNWLIQFKILLITVLFLMTPLLNQAKDIEFPLLQSFSYFPYSENELLEQNRWSLGVDLYHSNIFTFNKKDQIMNDFELTSFTIGVRYGITGWLTAETYFRYGALSGGFLDGFIENFHATFGLPDAYRPDYPRDIVSYYKEDYFSYSENTGSPSPLILAALVKLYEGNRFSVKSRIAFGLPLKSKPGISSDKPFLTAGLILSYQHADFHVDLSNYISWFKEPEWLLSADLDGYLAFYEINIRYKRFLTGFIYRTSPFADSESSYGGYQIQVGYRIGKNIDFLILEDFAPFDTTPDISFNVRIRL